MKLCMHTNMVMAVCIFRYEATAPYARRKLLTPVTPGGRALLKAALFSASGRKALRAGVRWPRVLRWVPRVCRAAVAPLRWVGLARAA